MGSITFLLVLVALRGSIVNELPKTSYFKYIDLWFFWYTTYIFSITIFHIILYTSSYPLSKNQVVIGSRMVEVEISNEKARKATINDRAKIILFFPFVLFNIIYFTTQIGMSIGMRSDWNALFIV